VDDKDPLRIVSAEFTAGAASAASLPPPVMAEIAFAGRSNVGKSSLLGRMLGRPKMVRTSATPGCTRQINFYLARAADGAVFTLVDLPGYGYAKRSKVERQAWADLIEGYLRERPALSAVVLLVDPRRGLEDEERDLIELVEQAGAGQRRPVPVLLVATKVDKLSASKQKPTLAALGRQVGRPLIGFSAKDGRGAAELWRALRRATGVGAAAYDVQATTTD
jgi:GTP-binding protein